MDNFSALVQQLEISTSYQKRHHRQYCKASMKMASAF